MPVQTGNTAAVETDGRLFCETALKVERCDPSAPKNKDAWRSAHDGPHDA